VGLGTGVGVKDSDEINGLLLFYKKKEREVWKNQLTGTSFSYLTYILRGAGLAAGISWEASQGSS